MKVTIELSTLASLIYLPVNQAVEEIDKLITEALNYPGPDLIVRDIIKARLKDVPGQTLSAAVSRGELTVIERMQPGNTYPSELYSWKEVRDWYLKRIGYSRITKG